MSTDKSITYGVGWQCPHCKTENPVRIDGEPLTAETAEIARQMAKQLKGPGFLSLYAKMYRHVNLPIPRASVPSDFGCSKCEHVFTGREIQFFTQQTRSD